jgi:hypothetical protein
MSKPQFHGTEAAVASGVGARRAEIGILRRALLGHALSCPARSTQAPGRTEAVQQTATMLEPSSPALRRAAARVGGRPGCRATPMQSRPLAAFCDLPLFLCQKQNCALYRGGGAGRTSDVQLGHLPDRQRTGREEAMAHGIARVRPENAEVKKPLWLRRTGVLVLAAALVAATGAAVRGGGQVVLSAAIQGSDGMAVDLSTLSRSAQMQDLAHVGGMAMGAGKGQYDALLSNGPLDPPRTSTIREVSTQELASAQSGAHHAAAASGGIAQTGGGSATATTLSRRTARSTCCDQQSRYWRAGWPRNSRANLSQGSRKSRWSWKGIPG